MAKKSRLTQVAVSIGTAMGEADCKAQQVAKAGVLARKSYTPSPNKSTSLSANCSRPPSASGKR